MLTEYNTISTSTPASINIDQSKYYTTTSTNNHQQQEQQTYEYCNLTSTIDGNTYTQLLSLNNNENNDTNTIHNNKENQHNFDKLNNTINNTTNNNLDSTTQIMNDMHQQQTILGTIDCLALNDSNQLQPLQNIMELVSQPQQIHYTTNNQQQQQQNQQQTIKIIQPQQQQQQNQQPAQVHTIMLNGQPAIFIPANSNLLCQMLMNQSGQQNQVYEIVQPQQQQQQHQQQQQQQQQQQFQLQIANPNDLTTLLGGTQTQNGGLTFIQIPTIATTNQTSNVDNSNNTVVLNSNSKMINTNDGSQTIICKLEPQDNTSNGVGGGIQQICIQTTPTVAIGGNNHTLQQFQTNNQIVVNGKVQIKKQRTIRSLNSSSNGKPLKLNKLLNNSSNNGSANNTSVEASLNLSDFTFNETQNTDTSLGASNSQSWLFIDGEFINGTQKRKRKACDCPNCIRWRSNTLTPEEMAKKRTHKCHKCNKEYNKTSHLRAHLRAHDNYRPYICDFKTCGKSFTRSDELKRHKRIHNDDRNFPCQICKKKFLRSDHLSKHLLVHNKIAANSSASQQQQQQQSSNNTQSIAATATILSAIPATVSSSPSSSQPIIIKMNIE